MKPGKSTHIIRGMQKDLAASKFSPEFAYECKNIRITPTEEGGLLTVTNEKGTLEIPIVDIERSNITISGTILGAQTLNNYVIIFTHEDPNIDRIYRLEKKEDIVEGIILYQGNLNFNNNNPIESLAVYENEKVQKVYWVDGKNQLRYINFVATEETILTWNDNSFNYDSTIPFNDRITISRLPGTNKIPTGVYQFFITAYNKYGRESNILISSSLYCLEGGPDEYKSYDFSIRIQSLPLEIKQYDIIRIYSMVRTSLNSTPSAYILKDIETNSLTQFGTTTFKVSFKNAIPIDAASLLYKNKEIFIPSTISQKDNTLFLGNIKNVKKDNITSTIPTEYYSYELFSISNSSGLERSVYGGLRINEIYTIGIQGMYEDGTLSNPIILYKNLILQRGNLDPTKSVGFRLIGSIEFAKFVYNNLKFISIRLIINPKNNNNRRIIANGIILPSIKCYNGDSIGLPSSFPCFKLPYVPHTRLVSENANGLHNINLSRNEFQSILPDYEWTSKKGYNVFYYDFKECHFFSPELEYGYAEPNTRYCTIHILGYQIFNLSNKSVFEDIQAEESVYGISYYDGYKQTWKGPRSDENKIIDYKISDWHSLYLTNILTDYTYSDIHIKAPKLKNKKHSYYFNDYDIYYDEVLSYNSYITLKQNEDTVIDYIIPNDYKYDTIPTTTSEYFGPISLQYKTSKYYELNLRKVLPKLAVRYTPSSGPNTIFFLNNHDDIEQDRIFPSEDIPTIKYTETNNNIYFHYIAEIVNTDTLDIDENIENIDKIKWVPLSYFKKIHPEGLLELSSHSSLYFDVYSYNSYFLSYSINTNNYNNVGTEIHIPFLVTFSPESIYNRNKKVNPAAYYTEPPYKVNNVFNQLNDFFTITKNKDEVFNFPNTLVWSKEKQIGADIDTWTELVLTSTLDLDGDKGEITSLNTFNNEIYAFQERGLSNILFNSRVQIPVSDGIPIEISNGYKVQGKRYISNTIGCNNKWSIAESPNGLYFIDNTTNSIYLFNGQVQSISDRLGFRSWLSNNNNMTEWDPINYSNFRSFYDKNNNDVYFVNKDTCLCYSELLGQFTSFYDYNKVPSMFNIEDNFYSLKDGKLWEHGVQDNTIIYGENKPYSITVISNVEPFKDKIFNTIDCRSDWSNNKFFNKLSVWNEYQSNEVDLTNVLGKPSNLKQKFRTWRINIPRDKTHKLDRMRNPWLYVKLSSEGQNESMKFYGMDINFFL